MANIKNTVFFKTLRSAFALDPTLNYAIRPTILYFTQYQKSLEQYSVAEKDWSDDIINFTSSIKPYHVRFDATVEKIFSKVDPVQLTIEDEIHDEIRLNFENVIREPQLLGFDKQGYDWERGPSDMSLVAEYNSHYATQDLYNTQTGEMDAAENYPSLPLMSYRSDGNYIYNETSNVWIPYQPISDGIKMIGGQWGYYAIKDAEASQAEDPQLGSFDSIADPDDVTYLATVSKLSELEILRDLFKDDYYFRNLANLTYFSKGWEDTERVVDSIGNNYKGNRIIDYFYLSGYDSDVLNEDQFDTSVYQIDYCIDGEQYGELEQEDEFIVRKNITSEELLATNLRLDKLPSMNGTRQFAVRIYHVTAVGDPEDEGYKPADSYEYLYNEQSYEDFDGYIELKRLPAGRSIVQLIYYDTERKEDTAYFDREDYLKIMTETFNNAVYRSKGSEQLDFNIKDSFVIEESVNGNLNRLFVVNFENKQFEISTLNKSTISDIARDDDGNVTDITVASNIFNGSQEPYIPSVLNLATPGYLYSNGMLIEYWERNDTTVSSVKLHSLDTVSLDLQSGDDVYSVRTITQIRTNETVSVTYDFPNWLTDETSETLDYPNDRDTYKYNIPVDQSELKPSDYEILVWAQDVVQVQTYDVTRNGQNMYVSYSKNITMPYVVNDIVVQPGRLYLEDQIITFNTVTNNGTSLILREIDGLENNLKVGDYLVVQNFVQLDPSEYTISGSTVTITKKFVKPVRVRIQIVYFEHDPVALTVNTNPAEAEVTFVTPGTVSGKSITVNRGTLVEYTVSASGYNSKTETYNVTSNQQITVVLDPIS